MNNPENIIWKVAKFDELSVQDLYEILKLRQEVFIVEQTCYYLDADGYDQKALHLWAEIDGKIVAYCRIFAPNIKYKEPSIGRVLTNNNFRRISLGKKLINIALQVIEANYNTSECRISAQDYLLEFYKMFGFQDTGKKYLEDNIPHTEMVKS